MPNILILGGTTEASALAVALADRAIPATLSYAGRTAAPRAQPVPIRIGGFGGVAGLVGYLRDRHVTHLVDATHPFAAQMSAHAVTAAAEAGVPMIALTRPAWQPIAGDRWSHVGDIAGAVAALDRPPCCVLLALGRMHVDAFSAQPRHHYLLRFIDAPDVPPLLPRHHLVIDRGPFTVESDRRLMEKSGIDLIVSKNAGGTAAAKLIAARQLGLPVVMIDRPVLPVRHEVDGVDAVLAWLGHKADRGV